MSNIKPSDHGIVVEGKESGLRYASLDENFDPTTERKIRDLRPGESVLSYVPKRVSQDDSEEQGSPAPTNDPAGEPTALSATGGETQSATPKPSK